MILKDMIREKFIKELCRRDDEENKNRDVNINPNHNEFSITFFRVLQNKLSKQIRKRRRLNQNDE